MPPLPISWYLDIFLPRDEKIPFLSESDAVTPQESYGIKFFLGLIKNLKRKRLKLADTLVIHPFKKIKS